jgi:DNA-binding MarR family transcriptional regulator
MMQGGPASREPWIGVAVKLGRLLERSMQQLLVPFDVTTAQYMALAHIMDSPGISRAELARALQVSPQAVSGLMVQLADKGLLERTARQPGLPIALSLTAAGRDTVATIAPVTDKMARDLLLRCFRVDAARSVDGAFRHVLRRLARCTGDARPIEPGAFVGSARRP